MILTWIPADHSTSIVFSRDATDYQLLLNYTGFAGIPGEHVYADKAPTRHGKVRKYTTLTKRELSFDVMILSDTLTTQQALVQALSTAFFPLDGPGVLQYQKEDGTVYYLNCIGMTGNPVLSPIDKSATHQKATIKLVADEDPFWYCGIPSLEYFDPNPENYMPFPNGTGTWPWSLSSLNDIKNCVNSGSIDAPIIVTFTGPMTNPTLICTKTVNGANVTETLAFTLTMVAGDTLIVNTDPDIMTARYYPTGGGDVNAHKYVNTTSTFWQMGRGTNIVELDPDTSSTGAEASVQWSDRYVGV